MGFEIEENGSVTRTSGKKYSSKNVTPSPRKQVQSRITNTGMTSNPSNRKPLSYADSRERRQWVERENAFFHSLFGDDEEFVKTGKINGLQVVTVNISGIRRQYQKGGKLTLNFQILDIHQRRALIEFLKFAKKGWKPPTDSNNHLNCPTENTAHGFVTTLLNGNRKAWLEACVDEWFELSGIFGSFNRVSGAQIGNKFSKAADGMSRILLSHSGDVSGMCTLWFCLLLL